MSPGGMSQLLRVLGERDIDFTPDDVRWAFDSSEPTTLANVEDWVREFLSPVCLLTKEELNFYETNTIRDRAGDDAAGRPLSDDEFESAISSLEASTAAIERQCQVLEAQKRALRDIRARSFNSGHSSDKSDHDAPSRLHRAKAQLEMDSGDLVELLPSKIQTSINQADAATDLAQTNVERLLEKDDRLLDGLEKILPQLSGTRSTENYQQEELEGLCQALGSFSSSDIHHRIDLVFRSAAQKHGNKLNGSLSSQELQQQRDAIRLELEELCKEIDSLSTMAVDNRYRNPISRALNLVRVDSDVNKAVWSEYSQSVLHYMVARLDSTKDHFIQLCAQKGALKVIHETAEIVATQTTANKQRPSQTGPQSPSKVSSRGLKPLRLVQANLSESQDSATQALRNLDIRLPDSKTMSESLPVAVKDKVASLSSFSTSSESTATDHISQSLQKADHDLEPLLGAVFKSSEFGSTHASGRSVQSGIQSLEEKTQRVGDGMRELNTDELAGGVQEKSKAMLQRLR